MVSAETTRTLVGILGNIIAFALFLSPAPTFVDIIKKKSVMQYSSIPYLATFANCSLWVLYGLPMVHPNSILVVTINGAGFVMEIIYLAIFITFAKSNKDRLRLFLILVAEFVFVVILAIVVLNFAHTTKARSTIVGTMAMAGNIMMYAAPLSVMKLVITTKSVEYMPFSLSLASFANGICWTIYALLQFDINIFVPNAAGTVLGLVQLGLYAMYYKSTQIQLAERKGKGGEIGFAEKNNFGDSKSRPDDQV